MPIFFISYRRDDSAGYAGRLSDALERRFGDGAVFRDVDDIPPGADFEQFIVERLAQVSAVLVLIGPRWLDATDGQVRRLDRKDDLVRREIELALQSGKPVIPVLVAGAQMMSATDLPPSLRPFAGRHALELRDAAWKSDVRRLEQALADLAGLLLADAAGGAGERAAQEAVDVAVGWRSGRRLGRWLGGAIAMAILLAAVSWWMTGRGSIDPDTVTGVWSGRIDYPWGVSMDERFEFILAGDEILGSAGYLGLPRAIEQGRVVDGRLQFISRTEVVSGDEPPRELTHRYVGTPAVGQISFSLHTSGAGSAEPLVRFTLRRP